MRDITQTGLIASKTAHRIYDENVQLAIQSISDDTAKEVFVSTILLRAMADLFAESLDFESDLDALVGIAKQQALESRIMQQSESVN